MEYTSIRVSKPVHQALQAVRGHKEPIDEALRRILGLLPLKYPKAPIKSDYVEEKEVYEYDDEI